MRTAAAVVAGGLFAALAPVAPAQSGVYSTAALPTPAQLRPLNLSTVWTTAVPVDGRQDGVGMVQVVDVGQMFVQTKAGILVALDATTGSQQWATRYAASYAPLIPVVVNDRYVFAMNVIKLYCIQRYTGVVEFTYNLPLTPIAAPAVDADHLYVPIGTARLAAFELPPQIRMPDPALTKRTAFGVGANDPRAGNPADVVAARYPGTGRRNYFPEERFEEAKVRVGSGEPGAGLATLQRTPSMTLLPTMHPPYRLYDDNGKYLAKTESLSAAGSLRQPYRLQDPTAGTTQRTPSISVIPPSVARVYELTNLLPKGVEPRLAWVYGSTERLIHSPLLTRQRVWVTAAAPRLTAVLAEDKAPQVEADIPSTPSAPPAQAEDIGYYPLSDGNLLAVRLDAGVGGTVRLVWRANVGGQMDRPPVPTADGLYVGGRHSGLARLDRATGEVTWRTGSSSDTLLAVNKQHAYVWDRAGRVEVYDRLRWSDPDTRLAYPLASAAFPGFNVPVTNGKTDRILLAADNGLLVCLRDASGDYARSMVVGPPVHAAEALPKKPLDKLTPADAAAPPPAEKKDEKKEEPKEPEKKD